MQVVNFYRMKMNITWYEWNVMLTWLLLICMRDREIIVFYFTIFVQDHFAKASQNIHLIPYPFLSLFCMRENFKLSTSCTSITNKLPHCAEIFWLEEGSWCWSWCYLIKFCQCKALLFGLEGWSYNMGKNYEFLIVCILASASPNPGFWVAQECGHFNH